MNAHTDDRQPSVGRVTSHPARQTAGLAWAVLKFTMLGLQAPMLLVIFFGDFGFYFPHSMGDYGDWVCWIMAYCVVLLIGLVVACVRRKFWWVAAQLAVPCVLAVGCWVYYSIPDPHYDAAKHQFLIGKTLDEVEQILGKRKIEGSGLDGYLTDKQGSDGEWIELGMQHYNGMLLLYSEDLRVVEVRDSP